MILNWLLSFHLFRPCINFRLETWVFFIIKCWVDSSLMQSVLILFEKSLMHRSTRWGNHMLLFRQYIFRLLVYCRFLRNMTFHLRIVEILLLIFFKQFVLLVLHLVFKKLIRISFSQVAFTPWCWHRCWCESALLQVICHDLLLQHLVSLLFGFLVLIDSIFEIGLRCSRFRTRFCFRWTSMLWIIVLNKLFISFPIFDLGPCFHQWLPTTIVFCSRSCHLSRMETIRVARILRLFLFRWQSPVFKRLSFT